MNANKFILNVIDDNQSNVKIYKIELKDGRPLPDWIKIDPKTGTITGDSANSSINSSILELRFIAEDKDGKERTIDVEINLNEISSPSISHDKINEGEQLSFITLNEQLWMHADIKDNYGEKIISLLS